MYEQRWQLADGTPNWDLYPDATHYCPETDEEYESFLKVENDQLFFVTHGKEEWRLDWALRTDLTNPKFTAKA